MEEAIFLTAFTCRLLLLRQRQSIGEPKQVKLFAKTDLVETNKSCYASCLISHAPPLPTTAFLVLISVSSQNCGYVKLSLCKILTFLFNRLTKNSQAMPRHLRMLICTQTGLSVDLPSTEGVGVGCGVIEGLLSN